MKLNIKQQTIQAIITAMKENNLKSIRLEELENIKDTLQK